MARSSEEPENGWLSTRDNSSPGLLSSGPGPKVSKLLSGQGELPSGPAGAGAAGVSSGLLLLLLVDTVLVGTLLGTTLVGILGSDSKPADTLDGTAPTRIELVGNLDGSMLEDIVPGGFKLVGNLEGTVLAKTGLAGTLEGTVFAGIMANLEGAVLVGAELVGTSVGAVLMVIGLVGTLISLERMVTVAWSPAPPAKAKPVGVEEEEVPVDGADSAGPGKRHALGVERARGWKETDGDTGPRGNVGLETSPAVWVLPRSVSCS